MRDKQKIKEAQARYRDKKRKELAEKAKEIREHKKAERDKLLTDFEAIIDRFSKCRTDLFNTERILKEALDVIHQSNLLLNNPDLTPDQKIEQIRNIGLSGELIAKLKGNKEKKEDKENVQ